MINQDDIKKYYEGVPEHKLFKNYQILNLRQEAIKKLCDKYIPNNSKILEIGCGDGIITKYIAKKKKSKLVSMDLSEKKIKIASVYVGSLCCEFKVADIFDIYRELEQYGKFEVILLFDIIEHIPKEKHASLFKIIENLLAPSGLVLITYPSPEYQEFIRRNNFEELQIVDESIKLSDILNITYLDPLYFVYKNIWGMNQYVHLVLKSGIDYYPVVRKNILKKIEYKVKGSIWRIKNYFIINKIKNILMTL